MSFMTSRVTSLRLLCYCQMSCFTTPEFYYWSCGFHTMGLTVECTITPALLCSHAAVVTRCVMETVISGGDAHRRRRHATMSACCYWKKAESWAGSGLQRSTSSVSPTAQRRDCLNLALLPRLELRPDGGWGGWETGSRLVESLLRFKNGQSLHDILMLLLQNKRRKKYHSWCS